MKTKIALLAVTLLLTSCKYLGHGDGTPPDNPKVVGFDYAKNQTSFDEIYGVLRTNLEDNPNIKIIAEVDHSANAASVGLDLPPTKLIFFGNPNLGTPLMQQNQLTGLDLPQKILVYQNEMERGYTGFNNTTYLAGRHGLNNETTLPTIQSALTNLTITASQGVIREAHKSAVRPGAGIITKISNQSFDETYGHLIQALNNNPNLRIVAEVDHRANATNNGLDLNPTKLVIFGNPNLGTPIMQNVQTVALDLPQKMLVWEDDDSVVHVSYNDPSFLAKRHKIKGNRQLIQTIATALDNLSTVALGN